MYQKPQYFSTSLQGEEREEGETIENKMERVLTNNEPIKDGAPIIYTKRSDGVNPGYNIRTDRFELAAEAMDVVTASKLAQRDNIVQMAPNQEKSETK